MAKANKKNLVEGIDIEKVDEKTVDKFIAKFKLTVIPKATIEQKVRVLARHLKSKTPQQHLADCDVCGGDSDVRLECCPYCGIGDGEEQPAPESKTTAKGKTEKKAPTKSAPTRQQAAKAKGKTEKPKKGTTEKPKLALVPPPKEGPAKGKTEKDLDDGVKKVLGLKAAGAVCIWELGGEVARIYDDRLYMLRKTKTGHGKYKNWSQFVQVELGMSTSYSYKLMDVAKLFTKKDLEVGISKLSLMIQLPEKDRKALLEKARDGMSKSEVEKEVRAKAGGKVRTGTGREGFKGGGAATSAKNRSDAAKKRANEVTVATQLGRVTIPLYQRPKKKGDEPKRAKTLAHDPCGTEDLLNGVRVHYRLVKQAKGLALVVERRREEPGK